MNYPSQPPGGNPQQGGPYGPPPGGPGGPPPGGYGPPPGGGPRPQQPPPAGQPYGGPPPGGQGYGPPSPPSGQPYGAPPPPGQPPSSYPTPPAPEPAPKSGGGGKVIKIVGGLVVIGIIVAAVLYFQGKSPASSQVGDCIKVTDVENADVEKVDCNSQDAVYKVAVTEDSSTAVCPEGDYVSYTESGSGDLTLCLALNAKVGDCIQERTQDHLKVDCGSADASFKVVEVLDGKADVNACKDPESGGLSYSKPALTLCAGPPNAA